MKYLGWNLSPPTFQLHDFGKVFNNFSELHGPHLEKEEDKIILNLDYTVESPSFFFFLIEMLGPP